MTRFRTVKVEDLSMGGRGRMVTYRDAESCLGVEEGGADRVTGGTLGRKEGVMKGL